MNTSADEDSNSQTQNIPTPTATVNTSSDGAFARLKRLATKELKETLRDRRTIITLILMPLLVYPILSLVFRSVLMSSLPGPNDNQPAVLNILIQSNRSEKFTANFINSLRQRVMAMDRDAAVQALNAEASDKQTVPSDDEASTATAKTAKTANLINPDLFAAFTEHRWIPDEGTTLESLRDTIQHSDFSLGVKLEFPDDERNNRWYQGEITVVQPDSDFGDQTAAYMKEKIERVNFEEIATVLRRNGLPDQQPIALNPIIIAKDVNATASQKFSLASLIPLILVLMTVTGAVYPAIDLTAGERERGTLETLMAAPVPRISILLAKFFAVWTVAIFTALLNLIGMAVTVWTFQLESLLLGSGGFSLSVIFNIFILLVLFSAFFSAVLLAVTSFARSFKEAQAYLIPIILLSMGPGLLAMNPDLELNGVWSVMPMVNILLLGRDMISQQAQLLPSIFAIASTIFYAVLAIQFAARRFGADNILYANQGSLGDLVARPKTSAKYFTKDATAFALLLLFPLNLVAIGALGRLSESLQETYWVFVLLIGAFTAISFFLLPSIIGWYRRVQFESAFASRLPQLRFVFPAILLGLFAWPLLMALVDGWYQFTGLLVGEDAAVLRRAALLEMTQGQVEKFRQLPPVLVALVFAVIPAFCEEWFFRGMVLQTWLNENSLDPDSTEPPEVSESDAKPNPTSNSQPDLKSNAWKAIILSAVAFGFFHVLSNSTIALDRLLPTTTMGLLLGYVCYRSGSIWPGVFLHALHNACSAFLGYYQEKLIKLPWFPGEDESIPLLWVAGSFVICLIAVVVLTVAKRPQIARS